MYKLEALRNRVSCQVASIALVFMICLTGPVFAQSGDIQQAKALFNAFATVAEKAMPAVVSIKVEKTLEAGHVLMLVRRGEYSTFMVVQLK